MSRQLRSQKGLTLVELMVVMAIIVIIAAIAATVVQDIRRRAKLAADQGNVAAMRSAVALYYGRNNGMFPADVGAVESLVTPAPTWQCGTQPTYTPADGKVDFTATVSDCP